MSTTTDLSTLKINYLTQSQYNTALANNQINEDEIYLTPTEDMTAQEIQDFVDNLEGWGSVEPQVTTFTPSQGSSYVSWGGCYYEKFNNMVHLHLAISGLTANTGNAVYTLPSEVRPRTSDIFAWGSAGTTTQLCHVIINRNAGTVTAYPQTGTYCGTDITYFI